MLARFKSWYTLSRPQQNKTWFDHVLHMIVENVNYEDFSHLLLESNYINGLIEFLD